MTAQQAQQMADMANKLEQSAIAKIDDAMYQAYMMLPRDCRVALVVAAMQEAAKAMKASA